MQSVTPFLWFDDQAEEASRFYVSVFSSRIGAADRGPSEILDVVRYGEAGPGAPGTVMTVSFLLDGQEFVGLNGGPRFSFNEAVSFVVRCGTQAEVDELWGALAQNGGEQGPCGWLKDRYGLWWQIVPRALGELMSGPNEAATQRVMATMLQMSKIDIEALERAHAGS